MALSLTISDLTRTLQKLAEPRFRIVSKTFKGGEMTEAGAGRIDMAVGRAAGEFVDGVAAGLLVLPQSQQHVVMTVEDCLHLSSVAIGFRGAR